ncbi:MAG: hypothetical protein LBK72_04625 [Bifidobacteriaceae bacterium]|jgi:hypothetical protein|nr:hypothetical protein [Bifidobacteriaceae bacterium]
MRFTHKTIAFAAVMAVGTLGAVAVPVAGVHATTQAAPRAAQSAYALTLTAPKTATLGDYVTIKAVVTAKATGKRAPLVTVQLQRKIVGTPWTTIQADDTDKKGVASFLLPFSSTTHYRATIAATSTSKGVTTPVKTTQVKGGTYLRTIVAAQTAKCVKEVPKYAKRRSKADPSVGTLKDLTAITSGVGMGHPVGVVTHDGVEWVRFGVGCGTTYKPDEYLASGAGSYTLQKLVDGKWTEVVSYQQLLCDQADHKGIPPALEPVCVLPDGTLRLILP